MKIVPISDNHWICLFANLSDKNEKALKKYFQSIYPRDYVKELLAAIKEDHVQSKTSCTTRSRN